MIQDIPHFKSILIDKGYQWTFLQVVQPRQLFGLVKQIKDGDRIIDHHIRCFVDGTVTTEIELRRVDDMWLHLTTRSISAHEKVISILENNMISYTVDQQLRNTYNKNKPEEFIRDYSEFFKWLFIGVMLVTPIGYIWQFIHKIVGFFDHVPLQETIDPETSLSD